MIDSVTIVNTNTKSSVVIDTLDSLYVLGDVDLGTIQGTHNSYKYYDQVGAYIESTFLEQRSVSISGWVVGDTYEQIRLSKKVLNSLINPKELLQLIVYDAYVLEFKPDFTIQYAVPYSENNEVLCKFLIQGTCPDPMFKSYNPVSSQISAVSPQFHFPLAIPQDSGVIMGIKEYSPIVTLSNPGEVDTGIIIEMTCTSSVTNPKILNVDTGEYIKLNKVVSSNEKIVISTIDGEKYVHGIVGGSESNYFQYRDWGSSWLRLQPGINNIQYEADENAQALEIVISFQARYLEVQ